MPTRRRAPSSASSRTVSGPSTPPRDSPALRAERHGSARGGRGSTRRRDPRRAEPAVSADLPNPLPGASATAATAIAAARAQLGKPYQYAGNGPNTFDCSGLTRWAYAAAGISLPRTSREQWGVGSHPALAELRPGDLLFWATNTANPATIHHVALYVGAGWMIQAPHTGDVVKFSRIYLDGYIGATRPPGV